MPPNATWLKNIAISEAGLIFDPSTGSIFTSNATGILILMALKAGKEAAQIKESLVEDFEVESIKAEMDLQDFLNQLAASCPEKK